MIYARTAEVINFNTDGIDLSWMDEQEYGSWCFDHTRRRCQSGVKIINPLNRPAGDNDGDDGRFR